MNARIALTLVVLLAVVGGGALLFQEQDRARRPQSAAALGKPLLADLKAADISAVRIAEPKATLTLKRKDDGWVIAERRDFPADFARVREFVVKLLELKVGQSEPIGEKDRARLALDAAGTQVEFMDGAGKTLAAVVVGKKYFKREVDNPDKAIADGRFVALPAQAGTVYVVSDPLQQASARSADWIDRSSFQVEKVKMLEVRRPGGEGWRIERNADNADWKLAGLKPGEKLDIGRANAASYSLSLLELADVAPENAADTGLDKPTLVKATTLDGLDYEIKVGRPEGENYYVSFTSSGAAPQGDDERLKKLRERLPREQRLASYILLIPKSKLDDTLKPRAELLEKKSDSKK
jgi:hypothetical protein